MALWHVTCCHLVSKAPFWDDVIWRTDVGRCHSTVHVTFLTSKRFTTKKWNTKPTFSDLIYFPVAQNFHKIHPSCCLLFNPLLPFAAGLAIKVNPIPANSHACGLKTSISRRLMPAGQFLTSDWKMWVVAILLDKISKSQTHVRNENHV